MAIFDGQIVIAMISRGQSMIIAESQLEAIAASPGPSMTIFDGQIMVVMSFRGPRMALDENQFKVIIASFGTWYGNP